MSTTVEPPIRPTEPSRSNGRVDTPTRPADLLRSVKTRQSGTRPWVWYVGIAIVAGFLAFLVVQAATSTGPQQRRTATTATTQAATDSGDAARDKWRYSGTAVEHSAGLTTRENPHPRSSPTPGPGLLGNAGPAAPVRGAPAVAQPGADAAVPAAPLPDISGSHWGYQRYPLPTPAPDDGGQRVPDPQQFRAAAPPSRAMTVFYGSPAQSGGSAAAAAQAAYGAVAYGQGNAPTWNPQAQAPQGSYGPAPSGYGEAPQYQQPSAAYGAAPQGAPPAVNPPPNGDGLADATQRAETMPGYRRPPSARLMVPGGTWIPAQLDEDVQSDVAGPANAHVSTDVVDPLSGQVLIPRGTRIIGEYTGLAGGQSRLSFVWKRLLFPDLSSFALEHVAAADENGHAGIGGRIDDHRGPVFRRTFLGGLLAEVGNRLAGGNQNAGQNVVIFNSSGTQQPGLPQAVLDLANRLNNQDLNYPPTVTIAHNTLFSLYVDRDMLFDAPYAPMRVK